jgi:dolichol-phosphate mannosyltransferase
MIANSIQTKSFSNLFRFALVGSTGTMLQLAIVFLLTETIGLYHIYSLIIGFTVAVTNNYFLNSIWSFKQRISIIDWLKYSAASVSTLLINEGILYVLTDILGFWYMFSVTIGILVAFVINYCVCRRLVWKQKNTELARI